MSKLAFCTAVNVRITLLQKLKGAALCRRSIGFVQFLCSLIGQSWQFHAIQFTPS
jgi:hypothetical protein